MPPTGRPAVGDVVHEDVAWSYQDTPPETLPIRGCLSFDETRAEVIAELPVGVTR